jgi:hypothetical protein
MPQPWIRTFFLLALSAWAILGAVNVYWANLNQDEGWYLYAAISVSDGLLPYRDFAFTQGPVMPFFYAAASPWLDRAGVEAGRWFTFLLAGFTLFFTARLASKSAGEAPGCAEAGLLAFMLLAVNAYQSQFTTIVKTYSLCGLLLVSGLLAAQRAAGGHRPWVGLLGGILLGLAAATRLSALFVIPVTVLFLLIRPFARPSLAWLYVSLGAAAALGATLLPFLVMAPEGLWFGLADYHTQRDPGSPAASAVYKAGFLSRVAGAYAVACTLLVVLLCGRFCLRGRREDIAGDEQTFQPLLWWVTGVITLIHIAAPYPYDDYQALVYPVFCAALGAGTVSFLRGVGARTGREPARLFGFVCAVVFFSCGIAAVSSPINQEWVLKERDRIWWRLKERSTLAELKAAAAFVRENTEPSDLLLTQDLYLAVQAGRRVPGGLEMGPFSYFPALTTEQAGQRRVLNRELLEDLLRTSPAKLAAISGYGLAIESPSVGEVDPTERERFLDLLRERYSGTKQISGFGQANTTLDFYVLKDPP